MKPIILLISMIVPASMAYAQSNFKKIFDAIEIKKSFENALDRTKPASMSFTLPAGEKKYYAINGGIAISPTILTTGKSASKIAFDIFADYNRNNQIEQEQNNFKSGLAIDYKVLFYKAGGTIPGNLKLHVIFTNEYLHDKIDTSHNFLSLFYLDPFFAISKKIKFGQPVDDVRHQKIIPAFKWIPGIEYYNKFNAPASDIKGPLARFYMAASVSLAIRKDSALNLIETGVDYTYRNDFYNKTGGHEGYLPLFNYSVAIYPFATNDISFGAIYSNGSDPVAGLVKQEYWLFEFKLKKNFKKK